MTSSGKPVRSSISRVNWRSLSSPMTISAVVKTSRSPIAWPPMVFPSLSDKEMWRCACSFKVPTKETISNFSFKCIIWKTEVMHRVVNVIHLRDYLKCTFCMNCNLVILEIQRWEGLYGLVITMQDLAKYIVTKTHRSTDIIKTRKKIIFLSFRKRKKLCVKPP